MPVPTDRFVAISEFHVRYIDTDAMRVVNHANYISWFEEARSEYARQRGRNYAAFEAMGLFFAVVELHVNFKAPAKYGEKVQVRAWVEEIKTRTIVFAYEVRNAETGALLTTGQTKHICIDTAGRVTTIPPDWREGMAG